MKNNPIGFRGSWMDAKPRCKRAARKKDSKEPDWLAALRRMIGRAANEIVSTKFVKLPRGQRAKALFDFVELLDIEHEYSALAGTE